MGLFPQVRTDGEDAADSAAAVRSALMLLLCSSIAVVRDGTVDFCRDFPLHRVLVCVS